MYSRSDTPLGRRGWAILALVVLLLSRRSPGEDPLKERIREAVDRGRAHMMGRLPRLIASPPPSYPVGHVALALAAVLRAGAPSGDSAVVTGLAYLQGQPVRETYSAACYLMALDALVQAQDREARRERGQGGPGPAQPARSAGPVRSRMEEILKWLIASRSPGQGWHYQGEGGHDNSNTQFAILGLQIGLEHHLSVPRELFLEITRHFARSLLREREEIEFSITHNPGIKALLKKDAAAPTRVVSPPGGWGYTAKDRRAYASMTAAGASSLLVARGGLGSLERSAEAALQCSLAWIMLHLDDFLRLGQENGFYTLYSLEKVGDLGDILLFGERDWYEEGANRILSLQKEDGGWKNLVDTSFALLFLTRATRPQIRAVPAPRVVTRVAGKEGTVGDQVYLDAIDGYVSAAEFLGYLEENPDRELLKVAEQVVRNFPLARQGELVPALLKLLPCGEAAANFARKALAGVTGLSGRDEEAWRTWHRNYLELVALEGQAGPEVERVLAVLSRAASVRLKARVLDLLVRKRLVASCPALIDELSSSNEEYRRRVTEALERLTGQRFSSAAKGAAARQEAEGWRVFWRENGAKIVAAARIRGLLAAIDALSERGAAGEGKGGTVAARGAGAEEIIGALVREGNPAVPHLLEALKAPEYPALIVVALERITSRRLGLRPAAWIEWWDREGKGGGKTGKP